MKHSSVLRLAAGTAIVAVGVVVFRAVTDDDRSRREELCTATVDGTYVELDLEQARYASLIAATSIRRGLPARASSIAIATAYQESKIHNIEHGDRDSIGLFQQRPSQGWGSQKQIMDPHYSIGEFFDSLVRIEGYREMEITEAAQKVQRSAYGGAYAEHEVYSRALASALSGYSTAAFSCQIRDAGRGSTTRFQRDLRDAFGTREHRTDGRTVTYPVPDKRSGWALAHYAVANAKRLGVRSVEYDERRWTARHSPDGWVRDRDAGPGRVRVRLG